LLPAPAAAGTGARAIANQMLKPFPVPLLDTDFLVDRKAGILPGQQVCSVYEPRKAEKLTFPTRHALDGFVCYSMRYEKHK